ncbi:MAG TPA: type I polyketide synthase [Herpetosiphon sp.]|uniref:Beta-ketoacyl synthase n=1 Tax=Herpetosiphon aurantiacus (strain ATCC 23779 / DSM 785 / 114-95) TaxID=316274 RepID=A9AUI9_HERA2|nr:type I polyketide synthase [Herpetosiphon sp.]ABX04516.1 Beta-ketoacyl synthase [Herpetosiphon aurantiacus DSM 785]HBW49885.1 type I polyketide synthase [Herpetosiphon sp.]
MTQTTTSIQDWLVSYLALHLGIESHEIDTRESFIKYGLSSIEGLSLIKQLEEWLDQPLSPTLAWDYPSIDSLARHLGSTSPISEPTQPNLPFAANHTDAIAIIGLGCRFPQAENPQAFWELLCAGTDAITEVPQNRWDINAVYDPDSTRPGKMSSRWGGFVDDIDYFDAQFFGISPREAAHLDPRQRLVAEVAWEALEDAGVPPLSLAGSKTGVFVGTLSANYGTILFGYYPELIEAYSGTGNGDSVVANRLSYFLDLRGPSLALNTACSGALVSIHLACQSLRNGESDLALAGGVNVILKPDDTVFFTKTGALAPDGRCKVFDSRANGIVRSEGAGIIILKRLADALADGDPIQAVILGSVINQDGASNGIMAPSGQAQEQMLRQAYQNAGIAPAQVQYIEAHGTGTAVGDPIEVNALANVLAHDRAENQRCALGSVKTNIGHTESASGVAGLIKTVLAIKHRQLPGNLHYQAPNPLIPFDSIPLFVQSALGPWPSTDQALIAGISGFGFSGTNAHVVVAEAPHHAHSNSLNQYEQYLLPISARNPEALRALAQRYLQLWADPTAAPAFNDLVYTAAVRRSHLEYRLGVVAQSQAEAAGLLEAYLQGEIRHGVVQSSRRLDREPRIVFVFSGQGSHWFQMGRELFEQHHVFRSIMQECDQLLRQHVDWSLIEEIAAPEASSRLDQTMIAQPAIFAIQVALAGLWRSWGIQPDLVIGQSVGEVAAAHVAGALSLIDAIAVIYHRSRLMQQVAGQGKTAMVGLPLDQARLVLAGWDDLLAVAGSSSPASSVLSGDPQALERVLKSLEKQGIFCRFLKGVDIAFHSPQMDVLKPELIAALAQIQSQPTTVPLFSTVTGAIIEGMALDATYWGQNLREPFLFTQGFNYALEQGYTTFLELSPHPVLSPSMLEALAHAKKKGDVLGSLRRNEPEFVALLNTLAAFYSLGSTINWPTLYQQTGQHVALPLYPWQRERYWFDQLLDDQSVSWLSRQYGAALQQPNYKAAYEHPLLGSHVALAHPVGQHLWELDLNANNPSYLRDHQVQGVVVLPGAAYLEMALAAAQSAFGKGSYCLDQVVFKQAMVLAPNALRRIEVIIAPESASSKFQIFSALTKPGQTDQAWTLHATGQLIKQPDGQLPLESVSLQHLQARCQEPFSSQAHYQAMAQRGLNYGPAFQAVKQIWRNDGEALAQLQLPPGLEHDLQSYQAHPILLDASLQVVAAAVPRDESDATDTRLPVGIGQLKLYRPLSPNLWCHAQLRADSAANDDIREADIYLYDKAGQLVLELLGLRLQRLESAQAAQTAIGDDLFYSVKWLPDQASQPAVASHLPTTTDLLKALDPVLERVTTTVDFEQHEASLMAANHLAAYQMLAALRQLNWQPAVDQVVNHTTLTQQLAITPQYDRFIQRALEIFHEQHWLSRHGSEWMISAQLPATTPSGLTESLLEQYPANAAIYQLVQRCGDNLAAILSGKLDPLQVLFKDSLIDDLYSKSQIKLFYELFIELITCALAELPPHRTIRILEVGAGTGSLTGGLLPKLPAQQTLYTFTDIAQGFLTRATQQFQAYDFVQYQLLDVERDPVSQGFVAEHYDLIVVSNVLHATADVRQVLTHLKTLLAPNGMLAFLEGAVPTAWMDVTFGLTSGWWRFTDTDLRPTYPLLAKDRWTELLDELGFVDSVGVTYPNTKAQFIGLARAPQHRAQPINPVQPHQALGSWLILGDQQGLGQELAQLFQARGESSVLVTPADNYEQLDEHHFQLNPRELSQFQQVLQAGNLPYRGVIHLWGLDAVDTEELTLTTLSEAQGLGCDAAVQLIQAVVELDQPELPRIWLVTRGAQSVTPEQATIAVAQAPLWGLGRVLATEHPELMGALIDLDPTKSSNEAFELFQAITTGIDGEQLALRQNQRYLARLMRDSFDDPPKQGLGLRPDASYLITGGLSGIGLEVARWMLQQGARRLILLGRTTIPDRSLWNQLDLDVDNLLASRIAAIKELENLGASIHVASIDVSDEEQLAMFLAEYQQQGWPPIRGVIHSAGLIKDQLLMRMDQETFDVVNRPKIFGSWLLHRLLRKSPLDFMIMFSSATSIMGMFGQANYAAGNAFVDALAHFRRSQGLPAMSINWGLWAETGIVARLKMNDQLNQSGVIGMTSEQGLEVMAQLFQRNPIQIAPMLTDWQRWQQAYPQTCKVPFFKSHFELVNAQIARQTDQVAVPSQSGIVQELLLLEPEQRQTRLEMHLRDVIATVLRLDRSRIDLDQPLNRLGLDSIMAVELKNRIEVDLGVSLSIVELLQGASIAQLTQRILPSIAEQDAELAALLAEIEQTPLDQVQALLNETASEGGSE